jgi:chromosome segregation ATPase
MSKINAADAIRASIRNDRALLEYADELEKVGSIEQAAQEANAANAKAKAELEKTKEQLNESKQALADFNDSARLKVLESEAVAAEVIDKAQAEATDIRNKAKERANGTIKQAEAKASQLVVGAEAKLAEMTATLAETEKQLKAAEKATKRAVEELAVINAKIEQAKLAVANVFNA